MKGHAVAPAGQPTLVAPAELPTLVAPANALGFLHILRGKLTRVS